MAKIKSRKLYCRPRLIQKEKNTKNRGKTVLQNVRDGGKGVNTIKQSPKGDKEDQEE
jgi:hypothetical protein